MAVITTTGLRPRLDGFDVVVIDVNDPAVDSQPSTALPAPAPDDIAYLIYTSGTTGVPKGVAITHHNVTQLLASLDTRLPAGTGVDAVAFVGLRRLGLGDLGCAVAWWAAGGGARVGGPLTGRLSQLAGYRTRQRSHSDAVCGGELSPQGLGSVTLVVGSEACPTEVVDRWAPGRVMVNAYGPTETTVLVAMSAPLMPGSGVPPIGSPVAGAAFFGARWLVAPGAGRCGR